MSLQTGSKSRCFQSNFLPGKPNRELHHGAFSSPQAPCRGVRLSCVLASTTLRSQSWALARYACAIRFRLQAPRSRGARRVLSQTLPQLHAALSGRHRGAILFVKQVNVTGTDECRVAIRQGHLAGQGQRRKQCRRHPAPFPEYHFHAARFIRLFQTKWRILSSSRRAAVRSSSIGASSHWAIG